MTQRLIRHWPLAAMATVLSLTGCASQAPAVGPAATSASATLAVPADYRLVWSDEFTADGLPDPAKWTHDIGMNKQGWHNREKQYYSGPRAENAEQRNGVLAITARKESRSTQPDWGGQAYSSSRLITAGKGDWTYGYFEVRAKLPCGDGTWPAIWTLASDGEWPAAGELDIMEHIGNTPTRVFSTVHTTSGSGGNGKGDATQVPTACSAFHTYQMHWTPTEIRFGIDGKVHSTYPNEGKGPAQWPFDKPQFLILNLAIGGDLGGAVDDRIFPVKYEVDFVRVYQAAK